MTKEELATERNEVREILEDFSEELSQSNLDKLSRVFCIINGDEKRIAELEAQIEKMKCCENCEYREPFCEEAIRLPFGCCCDKWKLREIKGK